MFLQKFDIYNTEWLDVVFAGRNKSYGAYQLRKHYAANLFKAMAIAAVLLTALFLAVALFAGQAGVVAVAGHGVEVDMGKTYVITSAGGQAGAAHHQSHLNRFRHGQTTAQQNAFPDKGASVSINLSQNGVPNHIEPANVQPAAQTEDITTDYPDVMPRPAGGKTAWADYLQQNLKYPEQAAAKGISGRVWVSFVVETDGRLTNIEVTQPAGFGFDEEAIRVLKAAPQWQPGMQNGQLVRVHYHMPISFVIVK